MDTLIIAGGTAGLTAFSIWVLWTEEKVRARENRNLYGVTTRTERARQAMRAQSLDGGDL